MTNKPTEVRVLLVEDDHDDALIIERHLHRMTRFSAHLTVVADLDEALALSVNQRFDAIFLDYYWDQLKADEYLTRHAETVRALPIIVITSTDDFTVNELVIEAGAWDFVCKADMGPKLLERTILHAVQRARHEQEMHQLIRHDSLTGLGNRMMFEEQLKRAVSRADRNGSRCAVMALDLDEFKHINDSLGHDVGDMLLRLVADRLKRGLREEDVLARLGGDEFAILVEDVSSPEQLQTIGNKLLAALRVPTPIRGISGSITGSFGISIYPDHGKSPLELMRYADIALYASKDGGRDRVSVFDDELEEALLSGLELEQDLRQAVAQDMFVPYFQPRFFTDNHKLAGVEVLMRWQHPKRGLLMPGQFIPAAERANLMLDMDRSLVRATLDLLSINGALPTPENPYRLAFNLTSAQLLDAGFSEDIERLVGLYGVPPEVIEFEIVERMLVERRAQETLKQLRAAGFGLCIDDFGTGFSSFSYLKDLPVTCLKIDRAFIQELPDCDASQGICEAVVCVGKRLGLSVIGEGIETQAQMAVMQDMGVDSVQGFLLARPMDFDQWNQCLKDLSRREISHGEQ